MAGRLRDETPQELAGRAPPAAPCAPPRQWPPARPPADTVFPRSEHHAHAPGRRWPLVPAALEREGGLSKRETAPGVTFGGLPPRSASCRTPRHPFGPQLGAPREANAAGGGPGTVWIDWEARPQLSLSKVCALGLTKLGSPHSPRISPREVPARADRQISRQLHTLFSLSLTAPQRGPPDWRVRSCSRAWREAQGAGRRARGAYLSGDFLAG